MPNNSKYSSLELPFDFDGIAVDILYGGKGPIFFEWSEKLRKVFSETQKSIEDGKTLSEDAPIYKAWQAMPEEILAIASARTGRFATRAEYANHCITVIKNHLEDLKKDASEHTLFASEQSPETSAQKILAKEPRASATERVEESRGDSEFLLKR